MYKQESVWNASRNYGNRLQEKFDKHLTLNQILSNIFYLLVWRQGFLLFSSFKYNMLTMLFEKELRPEKVHKTLAASQSQCKKYYINYSSSSPLLLFQMSGCISQTWNTFLSFISLVASCKVFPFPRLLPHMLFPFYPWSSCSLHPLSSYFSLIFVFLLPYYCLIYLVVNLLCFFTIYYFLYQFSHSYLCPE